MGIIDEIKNFIRRSDSIKEQKSFLEQKKIIGDRKDIVVFDIGAHLGQSVESYLKVFGNCRIFSFEPYNESFLQLAAQYGDIPNVKLLKKAVGNIIGKSIFYFNDSSATNSVLRSQKIGSYIDNYTKNSGCIEVNMITLDQFTTENRINQIDILKLDIQGGELLALEGAQNLLQNKRIKLIYTEVEFIEIYENQPLYQDIANYLAKFNYYPQGFYNFYHTENHQLAWCDVIFIPA